MTDDLDYVRTHISNYRGYDDEASRHDSDLRVRAYVGERLAIAQERLQPGLDDATRKMLDEALMRCMFTDQVFIRKFEHARLERPMIAAFIRSDRTMLELGEKFADATDATLGEMLVELDKLFEYRRSPDPVSGETAAI
jgi:hypothetical protein